MFVRGVIFADGIFMVFFFSDYQMKHEATCFYVLLRGICFRRNNYGTASAGLLSTWLMKKIGHRKDVAKL